MFIYTGVRIHIYIYIYICIYVYICVRTYTYTFVYTYAIHACMCEVRIYLYRVLYALAMDWSPFEFRDPCHYGIVWYGMVSSVLLHYFKLDCVFRSIIIYCVVFTLFTMS